MKFKVLSRDEFTKFTGECSEPYIAISITDPNSEDVRIKTFNTLKHMLSLQFHDVDKLIVNRKDCKRCKGTGNLPMFAEINGGNCYACTDKMDIKLFDESYADKILEFVSTYASDVDLIVVHCEAGISRSAGCAAALSLIYNKEDQYYFDNFLPNMLVYRKIINQAVKKGFFNG